MRRARRPVGFALHAIFAVATSALLLFDCSESADSFAAGQETAAASSTAEGPPDMISAAELLAMGLGGGRTGASLNGFRSSVIDERNEAPLAGPYEPAWEPAEFGAWYLAPKKFRSDVFDVIFHFHAGRAAAKEYREQAGGAVIVAVTYGAGSKSYADAFNDPNRFQAMLGDIEMRLRKSTNNPRLHVRRISLFAWSAGYGAIRNILTQGYYDRIDTIVLLDGLHANYLALPSAPNGRRVDGRGLDAFMRFAQDAAAGNKSFVFTHSSIVPPGYASTTETAAVLTDVVGAKKAWLRVPGPRNFQRIYRADVKGFHIRGFAGTTKDAHISQLHLVGEVLRDVVVPRWLRLDRRTVAPRPAPFWRRDDKAKRAAY
ncbi:hypothetical protein LVJ94_09075 [Pendulispora rubella]|uniref:Uncharacterized protein n=1 Tax=Pendulispora rubella TaxID=2741070 RepID=A0ABZ2L8X8_9BACT